jgi:hypothetical protein
MEDYTFGELILIQVALASMLRDLDITLEAGVAFQEAMGKTEMKLKTLRAKGTDQLPQTLAPDPSTGK